MDATNYILLLTLFVNLNDVHSTFKRNIYISNSTGHNRLECVTNPSVYPCATLDYVLGKITNTSSTTDLRNSTKIHVQDNQFLQKNYNLTGFSNFALSGNGSVIECKPSRGLVVLSSKDIVVENLTFLHCGSIQRAQNNDSITFHAGLFFSNVTNVNVTGCVITNSTGIGVACLNVGGQVMFTNTYLIGNINKSKSGSKVMSGLAHVGGGVIMEFTYNHTAGIQSSSHNTYIFYNCTFVRNGCIWNGKHDPEPTEADRDNVIFGCGGGMAITFKGLAQSNIVRIEHCKFAHNLADWGGGYYILFEDKSLDNSVHFKNVTAESNYGVLSGGAGRFFFNPSTTYIKQDSSLQPNYFRQEHCHYYNNHAGWGGGISVYGSSVFKETNKTDVNLTFISSIWLNNQAVVGSALGFLSNPINPQEGLAQYLGHGLAYSVKLVNCKFRKNKIGSSNFQVYGRLMGTGAVYVDEAPIIMENVDFSLNAGTALVLDLCSAHIYGQVNFHENTGNEGGAVALFGRSKIILGKNSSLNFISNTAYLRGGAIYAYSQGPNLKAFQIHLLDRSTCFFSYEEPTVHPKNWIANVTFKDNHAPSKSGKSIYCDTLQFCRVYGSITSALEWNPVFTYLNSTDEHEIVTDPVEINTSKNDWVGFPGEYLSPNVTLLDEKGQLTNGLLKMSVNSTDVVLGHQVSEYIFISDGKCSVPIFFDSQKFTKDNNLTLTLSSVYTQVITAIVKNITTIPCYGGYKFDAVKKKCACIPPAEMPYGYMRCGQDGQTIYLKVGYWATIGKDGQFIVMPCPLEYCRCANKTRGSYGYDECEYKRFQRNSSQCAKK